MQYVQIPNTENERLELIQYIDSHFKLEHTQMNFLDGTEYYSELLKMLITCLKDIYNRMFCNI